MSDLRADFWANRGNAEYTLVLSAQLKSVINNRKKPKRERIWAWIWLTSWGEDSEFCCQKTRSGDVIPLTRKDAATALGIPCQRVYEFAVVEVKNGLLEVDRDGRIFPKVPANAAESISTLGANGGGLDLLSADPKAIEDWREKFPEKAKFLEDYGPGVREAKNHQLNFIKAATKAAKLTAQNGHSNGTSPHSHVLNLDAEPFTGAGAEPFTGAGAEPFTGASAEPFTGASAEPFTGASAEPTIRSQAPVHSSKRNAQAGAPDLLTTTKTHLVSESLLESDRAIEEKPDSLTEKIKKITQTVERAYRQALLDNDPVPGVLLRCAETQQVDVDVLCLFIEDFAERKAQMKPPYPITSPGLFVTAAQRDLVRWVATNQPLIRQYLGTGKSGANQSAETRQYTPEQLANFREMAEKFIADPSASEGDRVRAHETIRWVEAEESGNPPSN